MMLTHRDEFFVEDGRLVRRTGHRPKGRGRWPNSRDCNLAVAVEMTPEGIHRVYRGQAHTRDYEIEAVAWAYDFRFGPDDGPDIGRAIPRQSMEAIRARIDEIANVVARRYRFLSNEERMTGALFGALPDHQWRVGEWVARFHSQGYSSAGEMSKETRTGADAGVLVEIRDKDAAVVKALWLQAKRVEVVPTRESLMGLPRLAEQMRRMSTFTDEGYVLIFTPTNVFVMREDERWTFGEWLVAAARCERGDRRRELIANTVDRDHLLEMSITR